MPNGDVTPDSLTRAIESVQDRIKHDLDLPRPITGANEDRTRHALIDPLLGALGWSDPLVLTTQYLVRYGLGEYEYRVPDYALHLPDDVRNPIAFLEAKRMNEPLTSDHRKQLFEATKYARDKGVGVQYCILTNGDRWDLYEPMNGVYRPVFSLSISEKSASECAQTFRDHFPKPPGFEAAGSANRPEVAIPVASESNALSRAPETNVIPSSGWTSGVDVPKALTWFAVSLISFGILGWTIGLSIAQPIENLFAAIGIVAVLGMLIVAVIVFRRFFPSAVPKAIKALRRQLFAPINGDRRKTRTWVAGTTFCGSGLGFLFGYPLGNSMADFITESLSIFGILFILVIIIIGPISISRKKKKSQ